MFNLKFIFLGGNSFHSKKVDKDFYKVSLYFPDFEKNTELFVDEKLFEKLTDYPRLTTFDGGFDVAITEKGIMLNLSKFESIQ